jgi:hypothetical protein
VACMERRGAYKVLVGRPGHRWEDIIKMNVQEIDREGGGGSWLRHCATSWKVTGLIPDGVTGIFH